MIMSETEENDWCAFCLTATDNNRKKIGMAKMFLFFFFFCKQGIQKTSMSQ